MSKKGHAPGPVPPGNRAQVGPGVPVPGPDQEATDQMNSEAEIGASEQDPKRRLGNYQTAGEHAIQQPGGKNDSAHENGGRRN